MHYFDRSGREQVEIYFFGIIGSIVSAAIVFPYVIATRRIIFFKNRSGGRLLFLSEMDAFPVKVKTSCKTVLFLLK